MRAVPGLRAGDLDAVVVAFGDHRLAERLGSVGVGPLPDREERGVLPERHVLVKRGHARLGPRLPGGERPVLQPPHHLGHVLRRGPAAPARDREAELAGERLVGVGQLGGGHRVVGAVGGQLGQAGVRHARQRHPCVRGEVAQVLAHLAWPCRAVQADDVDAERLERGERGADLRAQQHRPRRLDRHLGDQHDVGPGGGDGPPGADDRGLGLQQVLAGLHDQGVGPAAQQAGRVLLVGVPKLGEGDMAERGQLGARAYRAENPSGPLATGPVVHGLAGDAGPGLRQLPDPVRDAVFAEVAQICPERVGGEAIHPGLEVAVVYRPDDVRPDDVQYLVAALMPGEVVERGGAALQHGAHRAVRDEQALADRRSQRRPAPGVGGHSALSLSGGGRPGAWPGSA